MSLLATAVRLIPFLIDALQRCGLKKICVLYQISGRYSNEIMCLSGIFGARSQSSSFRPL